MLQLLLATALAAPPASVGLHALVFTLPAINEDAAERAVGRSQVGLSDFVGINPSHASKAVVLHFFDRAHGGDDLDALDRVQKRFRGKDVQVIGISADSSDMGELSNWLEQEKLSFPVLRDNHGIVSSRYGIGTLPLTVVIDAQGYVASVGQPKGASFETELQSQLTPLTVR